MANKNSNFYPNDLNNLTRGTSTEITTSINKFRKRTPVTSDAEVDQRIEEYINACIQEDVRPGIETACLYLGITRTTLFNWSHGDKCSEHRQKSAIMLKQFMSAYLEQLTLKGKLNPASSIFYLKNWCGYRDTLDFNATSEINHYARTKTIEQIAEEHNLHYANDDEQMLPETDF